MGEDFSGIEVFVIGGGDEALKNALEVAQYARKVTVMHKGDTLHAQKNFLEAAKQHPKIDIFLKTAIADVGTESIVKEITYAKIDEKKFTFHSADPKDRGIGVLVYNDEL